MIANQTLELLASLFGAPQPFQRKLNFSGKVRLRSEKKGQSAYWKEYKTGRLLLIYYGAFFQDNLSLTDWVNSQNIGKTLYCLGDGHDGIWNLFEKIADPNCRQEILDWYHLKENLYKIQATKKFLEQVEAELWHGQVEEALLILRKSKYVGVTNFTNYLQKHRHRLVNYMYFQAEQLSEWRFWRCRVCGKANR